MKNEKETVLGEIPPELEALSNALCDGPMDILVSDIITHKGPAKKVEVRQTMKDGQVYSFGFTATGALARLHDNELINRVTQAMLAGVLSGDLDLVPEH